MNGGGDHATDYRCCNRLHHVGPDARFAEDRNEAGENSADCHELWPQPMNSSFNGCRFNIGIRECVTGLQLMLERFMKINHHDHSGFYCDSEKCNVANRHGDAEVVVEKPL